MLFQKIQKILNIDIRKTFALKTWMRMSKKCGTSADADIPTINYLNLKELKNTLKSQ